MICRQPTGANLLRISWLPTLMFVGKIKSHLDGYENLPANGKFVTVMTSSSEVVIKELAKFVYKAFQQRLHHV